MGNKQEQQQELRKCEQEKCGFRYAGCKECDTCKAKPNLVKDDCVRCWNCENREGMLRWEDDNLKKLTQEEITKMKQTLEEIYKDLKLMSGKTEVEMSYIG